MVELPARIPPHNLDAERAVLGAILLEGRETLPRVIEVLRTSDFYTEAHRTIYAAMLRLFDRGEPVDLITLNEELRRSDQLAIVGGPAVMAQLTEEAAIAVHLVSYAEIVRDRAVLRELIQTCTQTIGEAFEAKDEVERVVDEAERRIFGLAERRLQGSAVALKEILKDTFDYIERLYARQEQVTGLPTGITNLDNLTAGLQPSDLILIAGRPSTGKTAFALSIALHVGIRIRKSALFLSLEMSARQLVQRMLSAEGRVNSLAVRTGQLPHADWARLTAAAGRLSEAPIFVDESPALSVLEVRAKARRMKAEHGLDLLIIDYLQLMRGRGSTESRQQEISEISRSLKALAKELDAPVIALSQLSRAIEARGDNTPRLSDLRECVTGDTLVVLADGRRAPIRDLVGTAPEVLAMSPTEEIVAAQSESIWRVGVRSVVLLRLTTGRTIRATPEHRLFSGHGWATVAELSAGDRVAIARRIPAPHHAVVGARTSSARTDEECPRAGVTSEVAWDRIVAIEPAGDEDVFDLTVPGVASWLADGIVSHNSGALEQDADVILFLHRPSSSLARKEPPMEDDKTAEIHIGKQRNGPTDTVKVSFLPEYGRFGDLTPRPTY